MAFTGNKPMAPESEGRDNPYALCTKNDWERNIYKFVF